MDASSLAAEGPRAVMIADYYALLGVDPRADRATIEQALRRAQPEWSSKTRHPSKGTLYQSYLDQIPEIRRRLLGEPADRVAYDAELAAGREAERAEKLDALLRLVRLRAAKGGLTVSDRKLLREEAERLGVTKEEFDRLLQPFPPRPESPAGAAADDDEPPVDAIAPATRRQIRIALDHLRRRDLYDLLDLPRDAPSHEIAARAAAERQRWMQKAQVTAEKTAWLNAVSLAQSHLTDPRARARYDRTLAVEAEEAYSETLAFALKGLPALDDGTHAALVREATALGLAPDRADRLIRRACRARGLALGGPAPSDDLADRRWLRCRRCSGLTEHGWAESRGRRACRHCHAPLTWECPSCRRTAWVDEPRCADCRFALEHLEPLVRHFEAAQHAHKLKRYEEALDHLRQVQRYAPHHVGARKGVEIVLHHLDQVRRHRDAFATEKARRRLVAARTAVEAWSRLVVPGDGEVRAAMDEVQERLTRALSLASRARARLAEDPEAARALFREALAIAVDVPEVNEGIRLCPPDGPTDLRAEVVDGRVRLRWSAPKPDGLGPVGYRILRKRQQAPAHAEDGRVVAEVAATEWEDTTAGPGESLGYAVFAQRQGVSSLLGVSAGPFVRADDVRDVRVEARRGEVALSWTRPPGAIGVRVVRKPGTPVVSPRDGIPIETLDDGALDRGLDDGRVYHYGIFTLWPGPKGKTCSSRGVFVSAIPQPPARPINDLRLSVEPDDRLRLTWTPPPPGHGVRVLRGTQPFPLAAGERRTVSEIERLDPAARWLDGAAPDHAFDEAPAGLAVVHYTPVTLAASVATVGKAATFSHIPDPTDLRAARAPHDPSLVALRWRWPPHGSQCLVAARRGVEPAGPDDPAALAFPVSADDYARGRSFSVALPAGREAPWHVAVYTVAEFDGRRLTSPGLEPTSKAIVPGSDPEPTLSYALRPPLLGRRWEITFRTDPPGSAVPPTALVAHPRTVPLSPDDGHLLAQFPAGRDGQRHRFRLPPGFDPSCLRLFPDPRAAPDGLLPIRLRHPEVGTTRV